MCVRERERERGYMSDLQNVAFVPVCCSVLQCVAVCCSVLQFAAMIRPMTVLKCVCV